MIIHGKKRKEVVNLQQLNFDDDNPIVIINFGVTESQRYIADGQISTYNLKKHSTAHGEHTEQTKDKTHKTHTTNKHSLAIDNKQLPSLRTNPNMHLLRHKA